MHNIKIHKLNKIPGTIRKYKQSDNAGLMQIFKLNTPLYFDLVEQKHFNAYLRTHADTYFVITEKRKIIGGGGYHISEDAKTGRISWNLIHPDHKNLGHGNKIVSYCIGLIKKNRPLTLIHVCTSQFAYGFYSKFGFRIVEIKKDFWAPGLDLYKMEMSI